MSAAVRRKPPAPDPIFDRAGAVQPGVRPHDLDRREMLNRVANLQLDRSVLAWLEIHHSRRGFMTDCAHVDDMGAQRKLGQDKAARSVRATHDHLVRGHTCAHNRLPIRRPHDSAEPCGRDPAGRSTGLRRAGRKGEGKHSQWSSGEAQGHQPGRHAVRRRPHGNVPQPGHRAKHELPVPARSSVIAHQRSGCPVSRLAGREPVGSDQHPGKAGVRHGISNPPDHVAGIRLPRSSAGSPEQGSR